MQRIDEIDANTLIAHFGVGQTEGVPNKDFLDLALTRTLYTLRFALSCVPDTFRNNQAKKSPPFFFFLSAFILDACFRLSGLFRRSFSHSLYSS